jgi:hypothetical protein
VNKTNAVNSINSFIFATYFTAMKSKNLIISFVLLVIVASLYRVIPRPVNFAPQVAMALFAGAVISNRMWAFALPVFSLFLSDVLYQLLYQYGVSDVPGFYSGVWVNYILIASVTIIGFFIKKINLQNIALPVVAAPTWFFIASNFAVWAGGGGLQRPKTWEGLLACYADALPFYSNSLLACCVFSTILFGGYILLRKKETAGAIA